MREGTNDVPQISIKPEEDARLPVLEARIERDWKRWRPAYFRELKASGILKEQIHQTALMCVEILHQYQNRGLHPDQAREVVQELIIPQPGR